MAFRLNFKGVTALIVDRNPYYRSLIAQMLRGFGIHSINSCESGEEAKKFLIEYPIDFCLIEADLPDISGANLIRWIRQEQKEPVRFVPILVFSGYTQLRLLSVTRDAGANLLLRKPVSAQAIYDRIAWLGNTPRAYIETDLYIGPDRRFQDKAPPGGIYRRSGDIRTRVTEPSNEQQATGS